MNNATRLAYLNAMGVQAWVRRGSVASETAETAPTFEPLMEWVALKRQVSVCTRCELHKGRTQVVFGCGDPRAHWMIIGEGPGAEEDRLGQPFVGPAGKLLNEMLRAIGLQRENVYIENIVKCRLPDNREPEPEETGRCEPYLATQIALVQPKIILALGRAAAQNLLKTTTSIGELRTQNFIYPQNSIPIVVTYHPAYLLHSPLEKRKAWQDLQRAMSVYRAAANS